MGQINIICIDDEREVLDAVVQDLQLFSSLFNIEECESADECMELLEELDADESPVALIISDHVMPGTSGIELLTNIQEDGRFSGIKKILLTGLATQADTIYAINHAKLNNYLEKVWSKDKLVQMVKELLTEFIIEQDFAYEEYHEIIDSATLYRLVKKI